jgi:bisphosphoglycerate-independent phosphoglycerate mutase (AlkP superfamily)
VTCRSSFAVQYCVDIADSAYKHGVADEDIDHAIANAEVTKVFRPGDPLVFITIGPDRGDQLLELI